MNSRNSDHPDNVAARKQVEDGQNFYTQSKMKQPKESLKAAKSQLFERYDRLKEEDLETDI